MGEAFEPKIPPCSVASRYRSCNRIPVANLGTIRTGSVGYVNLTAPFCQKIVPAEYLCRRNRRLHNQDVAELPSITNTITTLQYNHSYLHSTFWFSNWDPYFPFPGEIRQGRTGSQFRWAISKTWHRSKSADVIMHARGSLSRLPTLCPKHAEFPRFLKLKTPKTW